MRELPGTTPVGAAQAGPWDVRGAARFLERAMMATMTVSEMRSFV